MNTVISAVVLAKNEANTITDCLDSLKWCDEILVIDDNSDDKTAQIAEKLGAKVITHALQNDFSAQRNFALEKAMGEWVLFVDADERVTLALSYEILNIVNDPLNTVSGYYLKRSDFIWGRKLQYGESGSTKLLRVAKKKAGQWTGKVHEVWRIKGKVEVLQNSLFHYPHQTLGEFLREVNYYTDIRAVELHDKKTKVHWWDIILYPKGKFLVNYFGELGFLDGTAGLLMSIIMSFHSFLVRAKLWQLNHSNT